MKGRRVLVISLQGIGNSILALPSLLKLSSVDGCAISLVLSDNGASSVFAGMSWVKAIYEWKEKDSAFQNIIRLGRELRGEIFDQCYLAHPAWSRENALGWFVKSGRKIGYAGDPRSWLDQCLTRVNSTIIPRPVGVHDMVSNLTLFGFKSDMSNFTPANFCFTPEEAVRGEQLEAKYFKGLGKCFAIHPGSKLAAKCWGGGKHIELIRKIEARQPDARFLICGSNNESEVVYGLQREIGATASAAVGLPLREVAWLISKCGYFIGSDSSLAHIAGICGVPVFSIFGPSDPFRVSPVGNKSVVVRKSLNCSPCSDLVPDVSACCSQNIACLRSLTAEDVFEIVTWAIDFGTSDWSGYVSAAGKRGRKVEMKVSGAAAVILTLD